eukprot:TRINITY_DN62473_c0_g1_i1.p1 TRINITY_DN62473_c0_g1~~TRINITY_DN62473_c0_g1_i1.p1  ORF type:complete len:263 (-),score=20.36 TRINITY_DN62473_c0_g1_i1:24-812(-)
MSRNRTMRSEKDDATPEGAQDACLIIAHPDDEAMFFTPTLVALRDAGICCRILCLTTGNADGLGAVRSRELLDSAASFGIDPSAVRILDDPALPDAFAPWDPVVATRCVARLMAPGGFLDPTVVRWLFTFDAGGVSGHPNHIATSRAVITAVEDFAAQSSAESEGRLPPPRVSRLVSHRLPAKYLGPLGAALLVALAGVAQGRTDSSRLLPSGATDGPPVFWAGRRGMRAAWAGMRAHPSQLVWFRRIYLATSVYVMANVYV